jgi:hypothetical protein
LTITDAEMEYWKKRGLSPHYMYELAEEGWKEKLLINSKNPTFTKN